MRKLISSVGILAALLFVGTAFAHDPPGDLRLVWQWPANQVPVLDGDLNEWSIIPDEYSLTPDDVVARFNASEGMYVASTDFDLSSLSFRVTPSYINGQDRLYYGYERFDDQWTGDDDIEVAIDADHTGGSFWSVEGQSDEEAARTKGRQAQIYHIFLDDGFRLGGDRWNWFWMTQGDWFEQPPWSDRAYQFDGTPGSFAEVNLTGEFYLTIWDDYNWTDPEGSVEHIMTEGEIIGHITHIWDFGGTEDTYRADGCECGAFWAENTEGGSWGDASLFNDYLLADLETDLLPTAVEESSWAAIKASVR